ncbi:unnamed protein product [Adineta ricciae]|uniref:ATP-dependent DNA helicase n=1 Tax=Adineta ricciae TaxID=249248 RepID=A0A814D534_ADIRI|nr:unnamed protein product [Adineta ricciae]
MKVITKSSTSRIKRLHNCVLKLNIYCDESDSPLIDQLLSTRIFLILLFLLLLLIIVYIILSVQTHSVTIQSPSESTFTQLFQQYPSTLSCPCSHTSVRHDQFLLLNPQYHPICTSQLVNQSFIPLLSSVNVSQHRTTDYRTMATSHFQILALLCQTVRQMIDDSFSEFFSQHFTTSEVVSNETFNVQMNHLVEQLKTTNIANLKHTSDFLWLNVFYNAIHSGLKTNFYIKHSDGNHLTYGSYSYSSSNANCNCYRSADCTAQATIRKLVSSNATVNTTTAVQNPIRLFNIPGLKVGCLPYNSLLQSTLQCFFNQSCIARIQEYLPALVFVSRLSAHSRFQQNATVEHLLDQLFIESWNQINNFTAYFQSCSPHSCTYSYDQRFNILYVIVKLIGIFGGLKMVLKFSAPLIVKLIRRVQTCRCISKTVDKNEIPVQQNEIDAKRYLACLVQKMETKLKTLNLFPLLSDEIDGLYSTRLYIISYIIGIIALVFYTSISVQMRSITVYEPSLIEYERLYAEYGRTLICPCSHLSMSYLSIIHLEVEYHQVCSSQFVDDNAWLSYFNTTIHSLFSLDFRIEGSRLFRILQSLCGLSNETVRNQLRVFNETQFINAHVVSRDTFDIQTSILILQLQQQTLDSFITIFQLVRVSIQLNQFMVFGGTNSRIMRYNNSSTVVYGSVPNDDYDYNCSCGQNFHCSRSQGFYCTASECKISENRPNQTIPGLVQSCLSIDSLLLSTLECFYNSSCIQMLIEWRSFNFTAHKNDSRFTNVTPLDPMRNTRFPPKTKLEDIVSQLFIEKWINETNFTAFYQQCAPHTCTYTFEQRFNRVFIIATIFGIIDGLSLTLTILIPFIVKLCRKVNRCCHRHPNDIRRKVILNVWISHRNILQKYAKCKHYAQTFNLYDKRRFHPSSDPPTITPADILLIERQCFATRVFVIFFIIILLIVINVLAFNVSVYSLTIPFPSESTFESLQRKYSSKLSCPCSQTAVSFSKFLSIKASEYHQICSSDFVSFRFLDILWGNKRAHSYFSPVDDKVLSTQFRLLAALCSLANSTVEERIRTLSTRELVTLEPLSRHSFDDQIHSIVSSFIRETPRDFRRTHQYINDMLHANQFQNFLSTNWNLVTTLVGTLHSFSTSPVSVNESGQFCLCEISSTCTRSKLQNMNNQATFAGFVVGCLPVHGLRLSTLECLYSSECLKRLAKFVNSSFVPSPLNQSIPSRFTPISSTPIGTLIDELFIELWQNSSNYSSYYSICAPSNCKYTYVESNDFVHILTTILGLYGGLTEELLIVIWGSLQMYWKIQYLLIDEMSLAGLILLGKLNRILCATKHVDPQIPFGGINVIFFGDYLQYRLVYDASLHTDFSSENRKKSNNMRTEDTRYHQLLERLHQGQYSYEDNELLLTRVVRQSSVSLHEPAWNQAPMLVFRNEICTQLNHRSGIHNAIQTGCDPMVCIAQDFCEGKPVEEPALLKIIGIIR